MSLQKVYDISCRHTAEMIMKNGGVENDDSFMIPYQVPETVPLEIGFEGIYPTERRGINARLTGQTNEVSLNMNGCGFVFTEYAAAPDHQKEEVLEADIYIDNHFIETIKMPTSFLIRKHDVAWNYDLSEGEHSITLKTRNIPDGYHIDIRDIIVYSNQKPVKHEQNHRDW